MKDAVLYLLHTRLGELKRKQEGNEYEGEMYEIQQLIARTSEAIDIEYGS